MKVITEPGHAPIKCWTDGVELEDSARQQLVNVASLPFIHKHIAVMPDVHWGMGCTVGSVVPTVRAIIPAAVGVDLGCGMMAKRLSLKAEDLPDSLAGLRSCIEQAIPVGGPGVKGSWKEEGRYGTPASSATAWKAIAPHYDVLVGKYPKLDKGATHDQLGTLGTGNHFIEVCLDTEGYVWCMLHSGSRGLGNRIGTFFIEKAKEEMQRWHIHLPDKDLAYLPEGSQYYTDYIRAVTFAQDFARMNRELMMDRVLDAVRGQVRPFTLLDGAVNCHHNYIRKEHHYGADVWVTRKGAVSAREGELGIIPGSMGAKSFIVRGRGNAESFTSCSHGAGRRMSRGQARKQISLADHALATAGVECRKDEGVLDESPAAYKDVDAVMAAQAELVEIVFTLKQLLCVKG